MATTRQEQKRINIGAELDKTEININQAFSLIDALIVRLNNNKTVMQNYPAQFDAADIAEIDALLATISAKYTA